MGCELYQFPPMRWGNMNSVSRVGICYGARELLWHIQAKKMSWGSCISATWERPGWKHWLGVRHGGQSWTKRWRMLLRAVQHVKSTVTSLFQIHYTPGAGLTSRGVVSTWIMPDRLWRKCFLCSLMRIHGTQWLQIRGASSNWSCR